MIGKERWIREKARLIVENLYMYKMDQKPHYVPDSDERKHWDIKIGIAEDFIRSLVKEFND